MLSNRKARARGACLLGAAALYMFGWGGSTPAIAADAAAPQEIAWGTGFSKALKDAHKSGKPVMADFWADWCEWCKKLDRETYRDPAVVALSHRFEAVKVNTEGGLEDRRVTYDYQFVNLPTVAFFSPQGHLILKLTHYQGPDAFPATLKKALAEAEQVSGWEREIDDKHKTVQAQGLAALGAHLFAVERPEEGRKLLERATGRDATRPPGERKSTRTLLGRIRLAQNKAGDAEKWAREALALHPALPREDAQALLVLGRALLAEGQTDAARDSWQQALALDPGGAAADKARDALQLLSQSH